MVFKAQWAVAHEHLKTIFNAAPPTRSRSLSTPEKQKGHSNGMTLQKSAERINWRPLGDSNPCYRRERAVS